MEIKKLLKKNYIKIIFVIVGGIAGFLYWKFIGCKTGSCPIKSNWYLMTAYGIVFGYLAGDLIKGFLTKRKSIEGSSD